MGVKTVKIIFCDNCNGNGLMSDAYGSWNAYLELPVENLADFGWTQVGKLHYCTTCSEAAA